MSPRGSLACLLPHVRPHWPALALAGLSLVGSSAFGLLRPWPLKLLFDRALLPDGGPAARGAAGLDGPMLWVLLVAAAIVVVAVGEGLFGYLRDYVLKAAAQRVAFSLRVALFAHVQRLSLAYHDRQRTGDLVTRVTGDVDKAQELLTDDVAVGVGALLTVVGMAAVMLRLDWELALSVLVVLPLLFGTVRRYRGRIRSEEERLRRQEGNIASLAQETLSAIRLVQTYGRERHLSARFEAQTREALRAGLRVSRLEARFGWLLSVATAVGTAVVVVVGAQRVLAGALTPGDLLVFVAYARDFYAPLRSLSKLSTKLSRALVRLERVAEVLAVEPGVTEQPGARPAGPLRGALRFEGVSFAYSGGRPVLEDVDVAVEAGQVVALVGPSGAGKSTLAGLVPRLYDPTAGRVLVDGQDVKSLMLRSLRDQVAVVLQETVLFHATVRENIAYGRPGATAAEVEAAARAAGAHEFIVRLSEGYDTLLGERGSTLSGGQRQRLAIARALVRGSPLLILDEPTTGLDPRSEAEVLAALERLMVGRTVLLITHQMRLVERADLILVLERGRIVERGRHAELLRQGGLYARLCAAPVG